MASGDSTHTKKTLIALIKKYADEKPYSAGLKLLALASGIPIIKDFAQEAERQLLIQDVRALNIESSGRSKRLIEYKKIRSQLMEQYEDLSDPIGDKLKRAKENTQELWDYVQAGMRKICDETRLDNLVENMVKSYSEALEDMAYTDERLKQRLDLLETLFTEESQETSPGKRAYLNAGLIAGMTVITGAALAMTQCSDSYESYFQNVEEYAFTPYTLGGIIERDGINYRVREFQKKMYNDEREENIVKTIFYVEIGGDLYLDNLINVIERYTKRQFNTDQLATVFRILARDSNYTIDNAYVIQKSTIDKYNKTEDEFLRLINRIYCEVFQLGGGKKWKVDLKECIPWSAFGNYLKPKSQSTMNSSAAGAEK